VQVRRLRQASGNPKPGLYEDCAAADTEGRNAGWPGSRGVREPSGSPDKRIGGRFDACAEKLK
jgi:hypothetical protein